MSNETRKLNDYRVKNNYNVYFRGHGIDIGCGSDCLDRSVFKNIEHIMKYDNQFDHRCDAENCLDLTDNRFDFVYSSHCLEHINDPYKAFTNWIRICKLGGYIVFAVPHEIFYEKCIWPSKFNADHKTSWTFEFKSNLPKSVNILDFLDLYKDKVNVISIQTLLFNFDFTNFNDDQTRNDAVCQIECIVQRYV